MNDQEKLDKILPIQEFLEGNLEYRNRKVIILGNASMYLQGLIEEEPVDFDILIKKYEFFENMFSKKVDCIQESLALLSKNYKMRLIPYYLFEDFNVLVSLLSVNDIIINRISGYQNLWIPY